MTPSSKLKSEVLMRFDALPRVQSICKKVAAALKDGDTPVIENWNTYWKRLSVADPVWKSMMSPENLAAFRKADEDEASLSTICAFYPLSDQGATISFRRTDPTCYSEMTDIYAHPTPEMLCDLIFWGHRDKLLLTLYFKELGYTVTEGNISYKSGLIISF